MSDLKYVEGTNQLKPIIDHRQFQLKYKMTDISEMAFEESQKYNLMTAYGQMYQGCLIAGSIAQEKLAKKDEIIKELKDFNQKFIKIMNATSMSFSSFEVLDLVNEVKKKIEELENE